MLRFAKIAKPSILLTGSHGFIGSHFRRRYRKKYNIISVDRALATNKNYYQFNVSSGEFDKYHDFWSKNRSVSAIVHLGSYYDFEKNDLDNNYDDPEKFVKFLEIGNEYTGKVPVIFANSLSTLDTSNLITSSSPYTNDDSLPYIKNKISQSKNLESYSLANHAKLYNLFLGGVYSDNCELYLLYNLIKQIKYSGFEKYFYPENLQIKYIGFEKYFYPGNVLTRNTYIHVNDVCDVIDGCIEKHQLEEKLITRIMVGTDDVSYAELYDTILGSLNAHRKIFFVPKFLARLALRIKNYHNPSHFFKDWMLDYVDNSYQIHPREKKDMCVYHEPKHNFIDDVRKMINELDNPVEKEQYLEGWIAVNEKRNKKPGVYNCYDENCNFP